VYIFSSLGHLIVDFFASFMTPLGPYFVEKFNTSSQTVAMFISAVAVISSLIQVVFGVSTDFLKNKAAFLVITILLVILLTGLIGFAANLFTLFFIFLLINIANAAFHPLGAAVVGESSRTGAMPFFVSAGTLGVALGPIFITWLVSNYSLYALLPFSLMIVITLLPIGIKFWKFSDHSVASASSFKWRIVFPLFPLWLIVTIRTFVMSTVHVFTPMFMSEKGYSLILGGMMLSSGVTIGIPMIFLGGFLLKKIGNNILNIISFAGMGILILTMINVQNAPWIFLCFVLTDAFGHLTMSTNVTEAQRILPNQKALASSIIMGLAWASGMGLRFIAASLFGDRIFLVLSITGFLSFLGIIAVLFLTTMYNRKARHSSFESGDAD